MADLGFLSRKVYSYDLITKDSYVFINMTLKMAKRVLMQREHLVLNTSCKIC